MEFIKSIDWIFLLKIVVLVLFNLLLLSIYKSNFLQSNKDFKFKKYRFPKIQIWLEKELNKEGFLHYVVLILFGFLFVAALFELGLIAVNAYKDFFKDLDNDSRWMQLLKCMSLISLYYIIRLWIEDRDKKLIEKAIKENNLNRKRNISVKENKD